MTSAIRLRHLAYTLAMYIRSAYQSWHDHERNQNLSKHDQEYPNKEIGEISKTDHDWMIILSNCLFVLTTLI